MSKSTKSWIYAFITQWKCKHHHLQSRLNYESRDDFVAHAICLECGKELSANKGDFKQVKEISEADYAKTQD